MTKKAQDKCRDTITYTPPGEWTCKLDIEKELCTGSKCKRTFTPSPGQDEDSPPVANTGGFMIHPCILDPELCEEEPEPE